MKRFIILYLFFCLFCVSPLLAQNGNKDQVFKGSDYYGLKDVEEPEDICNQFAMYGDVEAELLVKEILLKVGLQSNLYVKQCSNIDNCMATLVDGEPYILIDPAFLNQVKAFGYTNNAQTFEPSQIKDWRVIGILAHEIGHHLNQHLTSKRIRSKEPIALEKEADEFAGFILAKLGASLDQAILIMEDDRVGDTASSTHPSRSDRKAAITVGWKSAQVEGTKGEDVKSEIIEAYEWLKNGEKEKAIPILVKYQDHPLMLNELLFELAVAYHKGHVVGKNEAQAFDLFHLLAQKNIAKAQFNLALLHLNGSGADLDSNAAFRWFLQAAEQGLPKAQFQVARMYVEGAGTTKDLQKGYEWLQLAAENGHAEAISKLKSLKGKE